MNHSRSIFPGAMGPDGFISCFDHLIDEHRLRRKLILKGGPGVGKSTFMRRIHTALCANDEAATLCFCSGDPDSLDAVVIDIRGLLILDGTAPHAIDPQIPGARDSIINLGAFLDEDAMRPRLRQIRDVMNDHAACTRRAQCWLRTARILAQDNAALIASTLDSNRLSKMTQALIQSALDTQAAPCEDPPRIRRLITDAVTPKGELSLIAENAQERVIRLTGPCAADFTPVLDALCSAALARNFSVESHIDPRVPGRLLHVAVPALHLLVTTSSALVSEQTFDFSACIPQGALLRHECALEQGRAAEQLHLQRAVSSLRAAKELHDELETFYVPNMDFSLWQKALDETIASLA